MEKEVIDKPEFILEPGVGALPLKLGMGVAEVYHVLNEQLGLGVEERPLRSAGRFAGEMIEGKHVYRGLPSLSLLREEKGLSLGNLYFLEEGGEPALACIQLNGVSCGFNINDKSTFDRLGNIQSILKFWGRDAFLTSEDEILNVSKDLGLKVEHHIFYCIECKEGAMFWFDGPSKPFPREILVYNSKIYIG